MDFTKENNNIVISNLNNREFSALLKCQVKMVISFYDSEGNEMQAQKILVDTRSINGAMQTLFVTDMEKKNVSTSYSYVINKIIDNSHAGYIFKVKINRDTFKAKEPLIAICGSINPKIVESCVYLDYDKGMFSLINKSFPNGESDKVYYFEDNNSVLGFTKKGPSLILDNPKIQSIEDIICS